MFFSVDLKEGCLLCKNISAIIDNVVFILKKYIFGLEKSKYSFLLFLFYTF